MFCFNDGVIDQFIGIDDDPRVSVNYRNGVVTSYRALAISRTTGRILGFRAMGEICGCGTTAFGRISVRGKKVKGFMSSHVFTRKDGSLVNVDVIYYREDNDVVARLKDLVLEQCKGSYQHDLVNGDSAWSGSDLKGKARVYAGKYAQSRASLLSSIERVASSLGVSVRFFYDKTDNRKKKLGIYSAFSDAFSDPIGVLGE